MRASLPQSCARAKFEPMEIPFALIQFAGSLAAIFAVAGLAVWLGLGRDARLASDAEAHDWAEQVAQGFAAETVAIGADGKAALLRDTSGQIMLLKQHGGHFAGRVLDGKSSAKTLEDTITVDSAERRFGAVTLRIKSADDWAKAICALKGQDNA